MRLLFNRRPGITGLFSAFCVILVYLAALNAGVFAQTVHTAISTNKTGYLAGETVSISGIGFGDGEAVVLKVTGSNGAEWFPEPVNNSGGTISASWTLPEDAGNGFTLSVPNDRTVDPVTFSRIAAVTTNEPIYHPDQTAHIRGAGFWPGESVAWQVLHADGTASGGLGHDLQTATADNEGTFTADWYVNPDDSVGSIFLLTATGAKSGLIATTVFQDAGISIIDDGGSNDPNGDGQNDLTRLTGDDIVSPNSFEVLWSWDEPTTIKGGNASNACAMFDTDGDGNVNYSFCVEVSWTAARGYFITDSGSGTDSVPDFPAWIQCSDQKNDRCTQPTRLADPYPRPASGGNPAVGSLGTTTCSVAEANTDPFGPTGQPAGTPGGAGDDYPADLTAACSIDMSLIPTGAKFINVCSYPSAGNDGNNNPFDCVVTPGAGFLTIVKNAPAGSTTPFVFTASAASTNGANSWTVNGSGTAAALIPYAPTTTLDLNEAVPSGWKLDSASCVIQPSTATGTPDAPPVQTGPISKGVQNFEIKSGLETVCTFNNSESTGSLTLVKVVDNLGETGAGYKVVRIRSKITSRNPPTEKPDNSNEEDIYQKRS